MKVKHLIILLLGIVFSTSVASAQWVSFGGGWRERGTAYNKHNSGKKYVAQTKEQANGPLKGQVKRVTGIKVDFEECWMRSGNGSRSVSLVVPYYNDSSAYLVNYDNSAFYKLTDSLMSEGFMELATGEDMMRAVTAAPGIISRNATRSSDVGKASANICGWNCYKIKVAHGKDVYEVYYTRDLGYRLTPMPWLAMPDGVVLLVKQVRGGDFHLQALSVTQLAD